MKIIKNAPVTCKVKACDRRKDCVHGDYHSFYELCFKPRYNSVTRGDGIKRCIKSICIRGEDRDGE